MALIVNEKLALGQEPFEHEQFENRKMRLKMR